MADKKKKKKKSDKHYDEKEKKRHLIKQLKIAYGSLENPKKFYRTVLIPSIAVGILIFLIPFSASGALAAISSAKL